jgi:cytochrome P450
VHEIYSPEFFVDPHPVYAEIREKAAAQRFRSPAGLEYWLVTRHAEARAALADGRLSKDPRHAWSRLRAAGMVRGEPGAATFDLHTTDPPEHTRLRTLVAGAFSGRRIAALEPRVQAITDDLLDAATGTFDLIADFAYPLSLTVIAELLGVPEVDRDRFRTWTLAATTPAHITDRQLSKEDGHRLLRQYVDELVRAKTPADDLLTALLNSGLTHAEVVALTQQLLFAGHEPVTNLIGNGMFALLRHPDQLARLKAEPALLPGAIEELLRWDGPTARSSPSYATADLEIDGTVIPAGSVVIVGIAAANRDPRRFADPDRLDLARDTDGHLAFGHGIHRCVGAALARLEGRIAIGTLIRRFPALTLAAPPDELVWHPFPVFRGLAALPVHL